jgi:hypothetical protein
LRRQHGLLLEQAERLQHTIKAVEELTNAHRQGIQLAAEEQIEIIGTEGSSSIWSPDWLPAHLWSPKTTAWAPATAYWRRSASTVRNGSTPGVRPSRGASRTPTSTPNFPLVQRRTPTDPIS